MKHERQVVEGTTGEYDDQLLKIEHYRRYPNMLPWVGKYYGSKYPKTIFVGESHYLPDESTAQLDIAKWYNSTQEKLRKQELEWINTREVVRNNFDNNPIWQRPAAVMYELGVLPPPKSQNVLEYFAFFNFFQRPAEKTGKGIAISDEDHTRANDVFRENLRILKPSVVIFLSMLAWNNSERQSLPDIRFDFVPHPGSRWWNMPAEGYAINRSGPLTGSERFRRLVKAHLLTRNT